MVCPHCGAELAKVERGPKGRRWYTWRCPDCGLYESLGRTRRSDKTGAIERRRLAAAAERQLQGRLQFREPGT